MPKDTFFNLPEKKRRMIEDAVIDEFAEYGFDNASINRIVEKCGIAKGSFYQYFDDKRDLFLYIMKIIGEKKLKYVSPTMLNPEEHDFFTLVKELYTSGLRFATENLQLAKIANQLFKNTGSQIYRDIINENVGLANSIYENMLRNAQSRNEIRQDIDLKFVGYLMTTMSIANFEYWVKQNDQLDIEEYKKTVMDSVDIFLDLIKNGIAIK